ncbi:hypothetical protein E4T47_08742 [Aureobasidium subglaciale]|nr:hypothetical protein E4T47_08742 [Aureobasidium subglaciale]
MRSYIITALVALATAHSPYGNPGHHLYESKNATHSGNASCISDADASLIATSFGLTISNYTEALAVQLFTTNFTDQSDSVNTLIHEPGLQAQDLGPLTFSSKADFLAGQGAQPPVPFEILDLWHTCDTVILRWLSAQTPYSVQGISIASVVHAVEGQGGGFGIGTQKWQISRIVAEFNSGAWLGNLGYPECAVVANATR